MTKKEQKAIARRERELKQIQLNQLKLQVKRVNQRLADLIKTYGINNELVKRYISIIGQISTYDPNAVYKIKSPSKLNSNDIELLNRAENLATKSTYTNKKIDEYLNIKSDELKGLKIDRKDIVKSEEFKQFVEESSEFHEFIENNANLIYNSSSTATGYLRKSSKLTKEEYNYILDLMKELKAQKMYVIINYDEEHKNEFQDFDPTQNENNPFST